MSNLKELKNRITSVKSTQKITSAMKMVAASRLKRAQEAAESAPAAQQHVCFPEVFWREKKERITDVVGWNWIQKAGMLSGVTLAVKPFGDMIPLYSACTIC